MRPKAYDPQQGFKYQIFCRDGGGTWEHCDYANSKQEVSSLIEKHNLSSRRGWEFSSVMLPQRYWSEP